MVYDVEHIILDNLQFMLNEPTIDTSYGYNDNRGQQRRGGSKFDLQNGELFSYQLS